MKATHILLIIIIGSIFSYNTIMAQCPQLVWADEFEGETLDESKWSYEIGDGCDLGIDLCGWGNNELQWYQSDNLAIVDGKAVITAKREESNGRDYTSTRIKSKGKGDIRYGRIESRMKLPKGQGLWPAFWMLATEEVYGGWPQSGEIDIMEYLGHEEDKVHGTLHFGNVWPNNKSTTKDFQLSQGTFSDEYHNFAMEWSENQIKWFVDGYLYSTKTRSDLTGSRWPFDQDFHFLLNIAVGGNWPGNPNSSTSFPQTMEVDYVRVYDMVDQAYLSGNQTAKNQEQGAIYRLSNLKEGSTVMWEVPESAELESGQGSPAAVVNWGQNGGPVKATVTSDCGTTIYELRVKIDAPLSAEAVLENFDAAALITRTFSSGTLTEDAANPAPDAINDSPLCGKYDRNAAETFDVLFYNVRDIDNAAAFITGDKRFTIDIYTEAPIGTKVLLQLENSNQAQPTNYPTGRHSRYEIATTKQGAWERFEFPLLDRPDALTSHQSIDQIVLLFAPNSNTGESFYFDNFEILSTVTTSTNEEIYDISIIPNPVSDFIDIQLNTGELINQVFIIDSSGKVVQHESNLSTTHLNLGLAHLISGLYYAQIALNNGDKVLKRFVKL